MRLEGELSLSSHELHELWERRARPFWRVQPRLYNALAEKCRESGENFLAIEVAEEGLAWFSDDLEPAEFLRLAQLRALAYASVGASERAREVIGELGAVTHGAAGTHSLLARTHKEWFDAAEDSNARREHLVQAGNAYRQALALEPDCADLAINAAAAALLLGSDEPAGSPARMEARDMALRARELCQRERTLANGDERERRAYAGLATMAECSLILGEFERARGEYEVAAAAGRHQRADLLSTRKQARLLLRAWEHDAHGFDACFPLPSVALFTGHMIDLPGRTPPRFPESYVDAARRRINAELAARNVLIGYGSAACGADLLFLRGVLDRPGGEVHIVLPFERERFRRESVVRADAHSRWGAEFDYVLAAAASVTELTDSPCWFEANAHAFGNRVVHGMAEQKAREFGDEPLAFALWDGKPYGERIGGTADCVRQWAARGRTRILIPPSGGEARVQCDHDSVPATTNLPVGAAADRAGDAEGESRLEVFEEIRGILCGEWEPPGEAVFAGERPELEARRAFYTLAADVLIGYERWIVHRWVDGPRFRLIFDDLAAAGHAAHALRAAALNRGGSLQLGLHAGPVVRWRHPLMLNREEPAGIHLQKARVLASLPPNGRTCVSREYAALLESLPASIDRRRLHCVYQGSTTLGEPFGRQALFLLAGASTGDPEHAVSAALAK